MFEQYSDQVGFLFVYIREAHPDDEWQLDSNLRDEVVFAQPASFDERQAIAQECSSALALTMPCVVDDMHNTADEAYAAWPERLFVVDADGNIAYAGGQGPFGFDPDEVRAWIEQHVRN